ncbi:hypothetical protein KCV00_g403, partial [Aureobasidium melanogenum]
MFSISRNRRGFKPGMSLTPPVMRMRETQVARTSSGSDNKHLYARRCIGRSWSSICSSGIGVEKKVSSAGSARHSNGTCADEAPSGRVTLSPKC